MITAAHGGAQLFGHDSGFLFIEPDGTAPFVTTYQLDIPYVIGSGSVYAGFTGANGGESARQEVLSFAFDPTAPKGGGSVSEVYVRGSTW